MDTQRVKAAIRFLDRDMQDWNSSEPSAAPALRLQSSVRLDSGIDLSDLTLTVLGAVLVVAMTALVVYSALQAVPA